MFSDDELPHKMLNNFTAQWSHSEEIHNCSSLSLHLLIKLMNGKLDDPHPSLLSMVVMVVHDFLLFISDDHITALTICMV